MKKYLAFILCLSFTTTYAQQHSTSLAKAEALRKAEQQTVLLNNKANLIPLENLSRYHAAVLHYNDRQAPVFDSIAGRYKTVKSFYIDTITSTESLNALHDQLKFYNLVIVRLSSLNTPLINFLKQIENNRQLVIVCSGAQNLASLGAFRSPVIWNEEDSEMNASAAAQMIFGGMAASGRLKTAYGLFPKGAGFTTSKTRLGYAFPESVKLNSEQLNNIDSIVNAGIAAHSAPSAVILLVKDGKVIFHKAYGHHTYNISSQASQPDDIFDLASITKVSATTQAVMGLYDKGLLKLEDPISQYVTVNKNIPDKKDIKIKEALLHEAGYTPYIKFFEKLQPGDMSHDSSALYPTKVADGYFLRAGYFDSVMWPVTLASPVLTRGKYVYSDVSMYMMKEVVENITHQPLNEYLDNGLYARLGMQTMGYLPRNRFTRQRIVPTTENDNWFRNMLVQGYVNDPGAAMAGGVEGHAGLFADANDMAILFQMLLNKGSYGGETFYKPATVELFTSGQSKVSSRALGFARVADNLPSSSGLASASSFGHSGYTGTFVWADPAYNMIYICLTNRVYPDDGKTYGPAKVNIRPLALDVFYKAVLNSRKE